LRVLLDTTAIYVAAGLSAMQFTPKVLRLLDDPETERLISAVSLFEIAMKAAKTGLTRAHVEKVTLDLQATTIPLIPKHAFGAFDLPKHHNDPFDRLLIATALFEDIPIVATDRIFKRYKGLRVIW
jgi:PIN domain nuclease of toxin-antitoxin system